jgi:hypothetical protein
VIEHGRFRILHFHASEHPTGYTAQFALDWSRDGGVQPRSRAVRQELYYLTPTTSL